MQAAGSLVNQRVVEILGDIANKGDKTVKLAEVTCVSTYYYGKELTRDGWRSMRPAAADRLFARIETAPAGFRRSGRQLEPGFTGTGDRPDSVQVNRPGTTPCRKS